MKEIQININIKKYISYFFYICIIIGIILHIAPFFYNRSLWIDESMLASSICTRDFASLISRPLDWGQSAPIGYLYIVKIFTILFGTSEGVLRLWSLITSIVSIWLVYVLLKDKVEKPIALGFTAFFSLMDRYIYYGNELKQYMSDNFFCLVVLILWQKFKENKIKLWQLILIYSILIWFSFSAVLFIAACMFILCFDYLKEIIKDKKYDSIKKLGCLGIVLLSFIVNYLFWLTKTSENVGEVGYWNLLKFPIIPKSSFDFILIYVMVIQFFSLYQFDFIILGVILLGIYYFIRVIKNKKDESKICIPYILTLILLLFASSLGFFPMQDRLLQPFTLISLIISAFACDSITNKIISKKSRIRKVLLLVFYAILFVYMEFMGIQGFRNLNPLHIYKTNDEVESNINYLKQNITENDMVYVYRLAIPTYLYETDYEISYSDLEENEKNGDLVLLPYVKENTILGQQLLKYLFNIPYSYEYEVNEKAIKDDADLISKYDSVYIFVSHDNEKIIEKLILALEEKGNVEIVNQELGSNLYHFTKK